MRKGSIRQTVEFLDDTALEDYKAFYYKYEMQLARYYWAQSKCEPYLILEKTLLHDFVYFL